MCSSLYSFWCICFLLGINLSREVIIPQWIQLLSLVLYLYLLTQSFSTYLRLGYGLMHFVTPYCKQLDSYSVCLLHAHPMQVGMQLLPAYCMFGAGEKEHEDDGGQNERNPVNFGWVFFCFGEVYFGCLSSPSHPPTPNTVCMFWRRSISQRENVIIADFSLGSLFDC